MSQAIDREIMEVLQKNLPAIQLGFVTEQLQSIPVLKEELEKTQKLFEEKTKFATQLNEEKYSLELKIKKFEAGLADLDRRESEVSKKELEQTKRDLAWENELLKKEVSCEKEKNALQFNLVSQAFASPVYSNTLSGMMTVKNGYGFEQLPYNQHQLITENKMNSHVHDKLPGTDITSTPIIP